jgi:hypothetical protein
LIGLAFTLTFKECSTISLGMLGISAGFQAYMSELACRNLTNTLSYLRYMLALTFIVLDRSSRPNDTFFVSFLSYQITSITSFFVRISNSTGSCSLVAVWTSSLHLERSSMATI